MKSSLPETDRHVENDIHWDDYKIYEILPNRVRDGYVAFKKQIIKT